MCTKEEVRDVVRSELAEIKEAVKSFSKVATRVNTLETKFDLRVEEFQKEGAEREASITSAHIKIRDLKDNPPLKDDVEKIKKKQDESRDKWEARLAYIVLGLALAAMKTGLL